MKTVWKFEVPLEAPRRGNKRIKIPRGGRVLSLALQRDEPCIWVEVDPAAELSEWVFDWVGTGQTVTPGFEYLGTVLSPGEGKWVFHLYGLEIGAGGESERAGRAAEAMVLIR